MDLSGIIFVVLAVAWAVYLIPKTLKQHDEVARTRSLDHFSGGLRVLARREPVNRRDSRLVVGPSVPASRSVTTVAPTVTPATAPAEVPPAAPAAPAAPSAARRTTARAAARRRRRVLIALLACTAVTVVAAFLSFLPGWSTALPAGLTVAWLVLCRTTVRRESARRPSAGRRTGQRIEGTDAAAAVETPAEAIIEDAALRSGSTAVRMDAADEPAAPDQEDTVGIPVAELHAQLHGGPSPAQSRVEPDAAPDAPSGTLWDPLPVTLPTYVTAPKARRTVRTIDLGEPGTWTSGRTVQDAEIAARATESPDSAVAQDGSGEGGRRAVGS